MKKASGRSLALGAFALAMMAATGSAGSPRAADKPIQVRLGTLAPTDSSYHKALLEMGEKWRKATNGAVHLIVYPDGRLGGEADMVRKMLGGGLAAATITAVGLSDIDKSVTCLQYMPMMFRSWDEVDYVREKLGPALEKRMLDKGFVVLSWGDAGWVRFFSKSPVLHPSDLKKMKLFAWAGDTYHVDLMRALGYEPRPLETAEIYQSLQTGFIDAAALTPFFALGIQCDKVAPHMLMLNWAPIVGATVIKKDVWDRFPASALDALRQAAAEAGEKIRVRSRLETEESVTAMQKRGLTVHSVTPQIEAEWRQLAESVYPKIRGTMVPADMFDEVQRLLRERRASEKGAGR
jgi:TRAP-type C4-dicarboxylate transport system substrate-binding protein